MRNFVKYVLSRSYMFHKKNFLSVIKTEHTSIHSSNFFFFLNTILITQDYFPLAHLVLFKQKKIMHKEYD